MTVSRQLTSADVHKLYVAHKYDEIETARTSGHLDDLLAGRDPAATKSTKTKTTRTVRDPEWDTDCL